MAAGGKAPKGSASSTQQSQQHASARKPLVDIPKRSIGFNEASKRLMQQDAVEDSRLKDERAEDLRTQVIKSRWAPTAPTVVTNAKLPSVAMPAQTLAAFLGSLTTANEVYLRAQYRAKRGLWFHAKIYYDAYVELLLLQQKPNLQMLEMLQKHLENILLMHMELGNLKKVPVNFEALGWSWLCAFKPPAKVGNTALKKVQARQELANLARQCRSEYESVKAQRAEMIQQDNGVTMQQLESISGKCVDPRPAALVRLEIMKQMLEHGSDSLASIAARQLAPYGANPAQTTLVRPDWEQYLDAYEEGLYRDLNRSDPFAPQDGSLLEHKAHALMQQAQYPDFAEFYVVLARANSGNDALDMLKHGIATFPASILLKEMLVKAMLAPNPAAHTRGLVPSFEQVVATMALVRRSEGVVSEANSKLIAPCASTLQRKFGSVQTWPDAIRAIDAWASECYARLKQSSPHMVTVGIQIQHAAAYMKMMVHSWAFDFDAARNTFLTTSVGFGTSQLTLGTYRAVVYHLHQIASALLSNNVAVAQEVASRGLGVDAHAAFGK